MKLCFSLALLAALPFASLLLYAQEPPPAATGGQEGSPGQTEDQSQAQPPDKMVLTGVGTAAPGSLSEERDQLVPELRAIETVESNPNNLPDTADVRSITRLLGTIGVERVRNIDDLKLAYVGGVEIFNDGRGTYDRNRQLQEVLFDGKLRWQRTQLRFLNLFSYLPEAPFGAGSFAGVGVFQSMLGGFLSGLAGSGLTQFTPAQFASIGSSPRLINTSAVELGRRVTPRGTLTATAAYGFVHFLDSAPLPNANQTIGEVGYNYAVRPQDTAAVLGGYGSFGYSHLGQAFTTTFTELFWGHQFNPRWTLSGGAGPVVIDIKSSTGGRELTWMAVSRLEYLQPRTAMSLRYLHYINGGSGFLLGAHSDVGIFLLSHQLTPRWSGELHVGFAHSSSIEGLSLPGVPSNDNTFDRGYAGVMFSRRLNEYMQIYVLYNYSQTDLEADPFCGTTGVCGRVARQQIGGVGFTWTPHPIRLP
jgi:hypothetical protein